MVAQQQQQQQHIKQSIIYRQVLRYKRICSNDEIFFSDATKLHKHFLSRHCLLYDILHYFNKVKQIDKHKLHSHTLKQHNKNVCFITNFIQSTKSNYHILIDDRGIGGILVQPPANACKQPPKLLQLLVRNTITDDATNRVANRDVMFANTPTLLLKPTLTKQLGRVIIAVILLT